MTQSSYYSNPARKTKAFYRSEKGMMKLITLPFVLGQPEKKQKTPIKSDPISLNWGWFECQVQAVGQGEDAEQAYYIQN